MVILIELNTRLNWYTLDTIIISKDCENHNEWYSYEDLYAQTKRQSVRSDYKQKQQRFKILTLNNCHMDQSIGGFLVGAVSISAFFKCTYNSITFNRMENELLTNLEMVFFFMLCTFFYVDDSRFVCLSQTITFFLFFYPAFSLSSFLLSLVSSLSSWFSSLHTHTLNYSLSKSHSAIHKIGDIIIALWLNDTFYSYVDRFYPKGIANFLKRLSQPQYNR